MLVYANALQFQGSGALNMCIRAIHGWVTEQLEKKVPIAELLKGGEWRGDPGTKMAYVRSCSAVGDEPEMYAWILKHPDDTVSGRQWQVEIGLKRVGDNVDFSCVTTVDELSVLVNQEVPVSRPRLIRYLVTAIPKSKDVRFWPETIGLSVKNVGDDPLSYRALRAEIDRSDRDCPLILVSPHPDQGYLVDPTGLQDAVIGLAQVVQVAVEFNRWEMEAELGRKFSAWDGAVNIIRAPNHEGICRTNAYFAPAVEEWGDRQARISRLLAQITHFTNIPKQRKRVGFEGVARLDLSRKFLRQRKALQERGGADRDMVELLEQELVVLDEKNKNLEKSLEASELQRLIDAEARETAEDDLRTERFNFAEYKRQVQLSRPSSASSDLDWLLDLFSQPEEISPEDCLEVIASVYRDRVVVLETAIFSAQRHSEFKQGRRLLRLLKKLVTEFYDKVQVGGDNEARRCFTNSEYAANESEGTQNNRGAREKRTFVYRDQGIVMWRHLKIGVADDRAQSIRVYFEWIAEDKKIVIGHCGSHLPIISY